MIVNHLEILSLNDLSKVTEAVCVRMGHEPWPPEYLDYNSILFPLLTRYTNLVFLKDTAIQSLWISSLPD